MQTLETVFARLADTSLTLNLAKCEFAKAEVTYLGKKLGRGSVKPVKAKVSAILEFPKQGNKRELRRFLRCVAIIECFAEISLLLSLLYLVS